MYSSQSYPQFLISLPLSQSYPFVTSFSIFQINYVSIQLWKMQPPIQKMILAQAINSFLEDALCIFSLHYLKVWPAFKFTNHQWSEYTSVYIYTLLTFLSNFHFHFDILTSFCFNFGFLSSLFLHLQLSWSCFYTLKPSRL